jgi:hypothetical protein
MRLIGRCLVITALTLSAVSLFGQQGIPTLRDKVRTRDYVWEVGVGDNFFITDLASLSRSSDLIIKGRIMDEKTRLSRDEMFVLTDYTVEILEIFKDTEKRGRVGARIVVTKSGGNIILEGKPVRQETKNHPTLRWIAPYILFINFQKWPGAESQFSFAAGADGAFGLDDGKVRCAVPKRYRGVVGKAHCGTPEEDFTRDLRETVAVTLERGFR